MWGGSFVSCDSSLNSLTQKKMSQRREKQRDSYRRRKRRCCSGRRTPLGGSHCQPTPIPEPEMSRTAARNTSGPDTALRPSDSRACVPRWCIPRSASDQTWPPGSESNSCPGKSPGTDPESKIPLHLKEEDETIAFPMCFCRKSLFFLPVCMDDASFLFHASGTNCLNV